jgi:Tfp pilus assembly protein PilN
MEELFNIIGKLYVDIYNTQKIIELLQTQLKEKDREISELKQRKSSKDDNG